MKPLLASVRPLADYLSDTEDDYVLVLHNFKLDTRMFSVNRQNIIFSSWMLLHSFLLGLYIILLR